MQESPIAPGETQAAHEIDLLTAGLPNSVKPIQTIVWVSIAIGIIGLVCALVFFVFR